ncbi:MAG: amino acid adenylation domain-containing protein [Candidatus Aminicenantes bacterium]|nr:MAG: amino acid adenylation domain-containing protein [Candidatus Aminicenantes bacterium]
MSVLHLFSRLEELGIILRLKDSDLKIKAPKGKLTQALINELKEKKAGIIEFLQKHVQKQREYASIESSEEKEYYALSSAQKRLYILQQMEASNTVYNIPVVVRLEGDLDKKRLEEAVGQLIARHESLRTSFEMKEGEPVQQIHDEVEFEIEYHDAGRKAQSAKRKEERHAPCALRFASTIKNFIRPFDLSIAPLLRVGLIQEGNTKHRYILMADMHHIISDGTSMEIFFKELMALYEGEELEPLQLRYRDYSEWQNKEKEKEWIKQREGYWLARFPGETPVLDLATDYARPAIQSFEGSRVLFEIREGYTRSLKNLALQEDATLYMVLLSIYNVLLSKLSGQEDIIVGTPVAGRGDADLQPVIGMFVNTLALRNYPGGEKPFQAFLEEVREQTLTAFENQEYQFEDLVEQLAVKRDVSRNPLFDAAFSMQNLDILELKIPGLKLIPCEYESRMAKFDLTLQMGETKTRLSAYFEYSTKLFKRETVERFVNYFKEIVTSIINNRKQIISEIEIISPQEKAQLLVDLNNTAAEYPREKTIHELFEVQVKKNPDRVAIIDKDAMTYAELNRESNLLARVLRSKGVKPDSIVGIMMEPSIEMIIAILAILKAGGAYLPIDPTYPGERVRFILEDCEIKILLTETRTIENYSFTTLLGLGFNEDSHAWECQVTPPCPQITHLEALHPVDRTSVNYKKYSRYIGMAMVKHSISLQGTRGCPYHCAYCHKIWPKKHVYRAAEDIFNEVHLYYRQGVRRFVFIDDIFNINIENSRRFFQMIIDNGLDIQIFFPNGLRGDVLTKDFIDLMVKAGTVSAALALETASPRLQKLVGKNLNLEKLMENLEYLCKYYPHVILELFVMHGFPTETQDEAVQTLDFIKSLKWLHFPYFHILKIYPSTDMAVLAQEQGISAKTIARSANLPYHELPDTLPFDRGFTLKCQADFFNQYFMSKERLLHVLPYQMKILNEDEMVQKYNSYLPVDIKSFPGLLEFAGIKEGELELTDLSHEDPMQVPDLDLRMKEVFQEFSQPPSQDAMRILLLDLSQFLSKDKSNILYDVVEPPLGLMYLMTALKREFGSKINGKVAKSRIDFDNYQELKQLVEEFKPDLIGLRTLTYYKDFFHRTAAMIRNWGINIPLIAGGPYATSDYPSLLKDKNIDLVVRGEGEHIICDIVSRMFENNRKLPGENVLQQIPGIAYAPFVPSAPSAPGKNISTNINTFGREIIMMDILMPELAKKSENQPGENLPCTNQPADTAYVIYTSGTTGKPKGVMIEHGNVVRLMINDRFQFDFNEEDAWTMFHSYCFDFSVWEMYGALTYGGKLILIPKIVARDTAGYLEILKKEQVTVLNQTPSAFYNLVNEELQSPFKELHLRYIIFGGEALKPAKLKDWREKYPDVKLINMYGITETTVHVTFKEIEDRDIRLNTGNIGQPIPTLSGFIMDKHLKLVPKGVTGELYIGGEGVARGYLNRPELTTEKFDHDLWDYLDYHDEKASFGQVLNACGGGEAHELHELARINEKLLRGVQGGGFLEKSPPGRRRQKIYRTGDLVRLLDNGDMEYAGRIDHQVKIRGFRVELGEIESQLLTFDNIKEAVVIARQDKNKHWYLCAYIAAEHRAQGAERVVMPDTSKLREYLSHTLPDYMIPSYFVRLERIPLTPNGKLDRKSLPEPVVSVSEAYSAPVDEVEREIARIWSQVLGIEKDIIGRDSDFFELGGHSLNATQVISKIHKVLNVRVLLVELFKTPSIRGLAEAVKGAEKNIFASIPPVEEQEYYPVSSAQKRMFLLHRLKQGDISDNTPEVMIVEGKLKVQHFEKAIRQLIRRHEALRTSFELLDGQPVQRIHKNVDFKLHYLEAEESGIKGIIAAFIRPFELENAPLLRVSLVKLYEKKHILMHDMHHIIRDGISSAVFMNEFVNLYNGNQLPGLKIQYRDFAVWQNQLMQTHIIKKQEAYWLDVFPGELPVLQLPTDYPRPAHQSFEGHSLEVKLSTTLTRDINKMASENGATLFMVLMTIYNILLFKYCGQEDIIVGTVIAARTHADLENTAGFFVNTLAMRNFPQGEKTFMEFFKEVKLNALMAYENQNYPFDVLVDKLGIKPEPSRQKLFDTVFVVQNAAAANFPKESSQINDLAFKPYLFQKKATQFDIIIHAFESDFEIVFKLEYCTKLFKKETIERFFQHLVNIAEEVVNDPNIKISKIKMFSHWEEEAFLVHPRNEKPNQLEIDFDL